MKTKIIWPAPWAHPPLPITYYLDKNPTPEKRMRWFYPTRKP
jgi:hypothetical protein